MREITDLNVLYEAFQKAKKGSDWKPQVQRFEMNLLTELVGIKRDLERGTYKLSQPNTFVLNERGKTRVIHGDHIRDRVVKRALCDEVLIPSISKYLIYDNGAGLTGKGVSFTRDRLETHLNQFYRENGSNDGYIYLADYTKFFDNIEHERLLNLMRPLVHDDLAMWVLELVLEQSRVDISYMSDEEYENRFKVPFNSLEHQKVAKEFLMGEKYLDKHMHIGDQVAQVAGVFYPYRVDNFIKIVHGVKYYGRYMDDSYIIHKDKEYLQYLAQEIEKKALNNGIFINQRKTKICKLSDYWRFMQIQYSLTETGRIIKKIHPKRLTDMRRKMKKLVLIMGEKEFTEYYSSWFGGQYKNMSEKQRTNMDNLFANLRREHYAG